MIHAYLFIQNIQEGNGGHGPSFKRIMTSINRTAGTNITVYHSFHDEVELYRTHVWRCNGICQHRKPFWGYVKRAQNRAPGPYDRWFKDHHQSCGGTFQKVSGPEPQNPPQNPPKNPQKKSKKTELSKPPPSLSTTPSKGGAKGLPSVAGWLKGNGGGTLLVKPSTKNIPTATTVSGDSFSGASDSAAGGNLRNVVGFRDMNESGSGKLDHTFIFCI